MTLVALIAGVLGIANLYWQVNMLLPVPLQVLSVVAQLALTLITIVAMVRFRGQRSRPSYDGGQYTIWNVGFAVIVVSFIGNLTLLAYFTLHLFGVVSSL